MTRKDYLAISQAIRAVMDRSDNCTAIRLVAESIADVLTAENRPGFNAYRFLADCGVSRIHRESYIDRRSHDNSRTE